MTRPLSLAFTASSVLLRKPERFFIFCICVFTVATEINSFSAMAASVSPPTTRRSTSSSLSENCSLAEIAEREGISRQGVRDILTRAERQLSEAEAAVGLIRKEALQTAKLRALRNRFKDVPLSDADRAAFETGLAELAGIWEDEDGV